MYNAQKLEERIKIAAVNKDVTVKELLSACGLNVNTINQMTDKKGIASFSLAKIADQLECSIDYLLGRTDNPTSHTTQAGSTVNNAPISGNFNAVGSANTVNVNTQQLDDHQKLLIDLYNKLSSIEQIELINDLNTRLK